MIPANQVEVSELVKHYGALRAVDGLNFTVEAGEVLGFLGPNGAGKSTTMKMITGFVTPTAGQVRVCGHFIDQEPLAAKRCLGYLPEGAPAYSEMTPWQFLNFIADVRHLRDRAARLDAVIGQLGLEPVLNQSVDTLSKGFRRRVGLAQAILHDPQVLIMDEPTDGLDPNQKRQVRAFINEMASDKVIIVSTHILEEVDAMCTRAIIIADGRILVDDTPYGLRQRSRYHNAVIVAAELTPAARDALVACNEVAAVERERTGDWTVIPRTGCRIEDTVQGILQEYGMADASSRRHAGRLEDVFHSLTLREREA